MRTDFQTLASRVPGFSQKYTYSDFAESFTLYSSRVFDYSHEVADSAVFVPLGDLFNHSFDPNLYYETHADGFYAYANRNISLDEELSISYGYSKTNAALFSHYGFTSEQAKHRYSFSFVANFNSSKKDELQAQK